MQFFREGHIPPPHHLQKKNPAPVGVSGWEKGCLLCKCNANAMQMQCNGSMWPSRQMLDSREYDSKQ